MDRRKFLKSIGALGLAPAIPLPSLSLGAAAAPAVSHHTYMWAEMIVRAHNKCGPGMLERLLSVDPGTAAALKSQLLKNGVISAQANAYGLHTATKPLYEGAFVYSHKPIEKITRTVVDFVEDALDETEELSENESEIKSLSNDIESEPHEVEPISEVEISPQQP